MKDTFLMTSDLKKRGWTRAMVRKFLGNPDRTAKNPRYRSKAPMRLYALERAQKIETTEEFKRELEKVPLRKSRAEKAVATKLAKMAAYIEGLSVSLPSMTVEELRSKAIDHYNFRGPGANEERAERWQSAGLHSDPAFLARISVNYLRHQCTHYESHLGELSGKTGVDEGRARIKKKVLSAIASSFPWLAEACHAQAARADDRAGFIASLKEFAEG